MKKEGESARNIAFYISTNRDKQRQNTVLSFPDDEELGEVERLEILINRELLKYWIEDIM